MMMAQTTTGPARGPRPTSSIPAISGPAVFLSSRSIGFHRSRAMAARLLGRLVAGFRHRNARLAFLNARRLAGEMAEVVELGATDAATTSDDDLSEHRAVDRED